jgi:hypothetical protein
VSTALFRNTSTHPVELADGRLLAVGDDADLDLRDEHGVHAHLLESEQITRVQMPKDPDPEPPKPSGGKTGPTTTTTSEKAGS